MTIDEAYITAERAMRDALSALEDLDDPTLSSPEYLALDSTYRAAYEAYLEARAAYMPWTVPGYKATKKGA